MGLLRHRIVPEDPGPPDAGIYAAVVLGLLVAVALGVTRLLGLW